MATCLTLSPSVDTVFPPSPPLPRRRSVPRRKPLQSMATTARTPTPTPKPVPSHPPAGSSKTQFLHALTKGIPLDRRYWRCQRLKYDEVRKTLSLWYDKLPENLPHSIDSITIIPHSTPIYTSLLAFPSPDGRIIPILQRIIRNFNPYDPLPEDIDSLFNIFDAAESIDVFVGYIAIYFDTEEKLLMYVVQHGVEFEIDDYYILLRRSRWQPSMAPEPITVRILSSHSLY
jgi:hypothetical protein